MHKISLPERLKFFLPFIVLLAVLVLLMPRAAKFNFDYRKGSPWKYEALISQFDFPILKTEEQMQEDREKYPMKRYGEPSDIAFGIIYLLSDASSWVTGQSLVIDGGITI